MFKPCFHKNLKIRLDHIFAKNYINASLTRQSINDSEAIETSTEGCRSDGAWPHANSKASSSKHSYEPQTPWPHRQQASEVLWRTRCMSAATQQETVDWWKWCLTSPNWRATTIKANKTKFQYPLMGYIKLNKPSAEGSESKLSCTRKGGQDEQSRPPKKSLRS